MFNGEKSGMVYSEDLRQRVVDAVRNKGINKAEVARMFKVSRWCVVHWLRLDDLTPKKTGPKKASKLDATELLQSVEASPDATLRERAKDLNVTPQAVFYALKRLKITRKKNDRLPTAG